jgi:hypothetical protein
MKSKKKSKRASYLLEGDLSRGDLERRLRLVGFFPALRERDLDLLRERSRSRSRDFDFDLDLDFDFDLDLEREERPLKLYGTR